MTAIEVVLRQIDQAFDHKSWHGTNLRGSIRGLGAAEAAWRPQPDRHNIWELVLHAAYWKYTVLRRIDGRDRGSFPLAGSNFFMRPESESFTEAQWKADVGILVDTHRNLRACIAGLSEERLESGTSGTLRILDLVIGIAAHDLYHAGQIQTLKRLQSNG